MVQDSRLMVDMDIVNILQQFIECEGKSCSFDPELITPEYVYRMWGGQVSLKEILSAWPVDRRDLC